MAITVVDQNVYYKGTSQGTPPTDGDKYGKAGGDGYGGAFCTRYGLKTDSPISSFTIKLKYINDNTSSSKYLGVYVSPTANSAYHNCYGGKSGITTQGYLRFGWKCTNKGSFTSGTSGVAEATITGLSIPAGNFYVYIFPQQALTTNSQSSWYAPNANSTSNRATFTGSWSGSTYTISYNANGGTGAPSSQTKYQGISLTLSSTKPTKSNTTATTNNTITVSYNANGGSSTPSSGTGTQKVTTTTSYTFKNWNTNSGGTGTSYNAGASYTANAGATLYAQYTESSTSQTTNPSITTAAAISRADSSAGSYTITYNANGGVCSTPTASAERVTSYTFNGWNTNSSGTGTNYTANTSQVFSASVTLYAKWSSSTTTVAVTLPTPTRTGHTFKGWSTSSTATSGSVGTYTPTANVTLYAIWEPETYTLTIQTEEGIRVAAIREDGTGIGSGAQISYGETLIVFVQLEGNTKLGSLTLNGTAIERNSAHIVTGNIVIIATAKKGGIIYIHNGTKWVGYEVYIYNGSIWVQHEPYVFNNNEWKLCE